MALGIVDFVVSFPDPALPGGETCMGKRSGWVNSGARIQAPKALGAYPHLATMVTDLHLGAWLAIAFFPIYTARPYHTEILYLARYSIYAHTHRLATHNYRSSSLP